MLCDDIGLHIDAVSGYIDSIINEEILLIKYYKSREAYEEGSAEKYEWAAPPKSGDAKELQEKLVKKSSGLSRLFAEKLLLLKDKTLETGGSIEILE